MIGYLDTSAALRVLTIGPRPGAARLTRRTQRYLDQLVEQGHTVVSSVLLRTEILCQANRQPEIDTNEVEEFLSMVNLVALDASDLDEAPNTPGELRTLDAIHLRVALRIGADVMVTYDDELTRAAQAIGMGTGP
ncbi:type II toxin-antitoxin system VapC family toxin [Mycobacterium sp.]|uniref:type II toxin-antitoxin system VapC family toxin n=1 Tax=Mycobacterium sp. TaxID=1785 RepID=UPI002EF36130